MWEEVEKIEKAIFSGITVISDRYFFSSIAYSAAKQNMDFNWCQKMTLGLPKPDVVIYLDGFAKPIVCRSIFGKERFEEIDFQNKVDTLYKQLRTDKWLYIYASSPIGVVTSELEKVIKRSYQ